MSPSQPSIPSGPSSPGVPKIARLVRPKRVVVGRLLPSPCIKNDRCVRLCGHSRRSLSLSTLSITVHGSSKALDAHCPLASILRGLRTGDCLLLAGGLRNIASFCSVTSPSTLYKLTGLPVLTGASSALMLFHATSRVVVSRITCSSG